VNGGVYRPGIATAWAIWFEEKWTPWLRGLKVLVNIPYE